MNEASASAMICPECPVSMSVVIAPTNDRTYRHGDHQITFTARDLAEQHDPITYMRDTFNEWHAKVLPTLPKDVGIIADFAELRSAPDPNAIDVIEVAEAGAKRANKLLAAGWKLLNVGVTTTDRTRPDGQPTMARRTTYALGRPPGVLPEVFEEERTSPPSIANQHAARPRMMLVGVEGDIFHIHQWREDCDVRGCIVATEEMINDEHARLDALRSTTAPERVEPERPKDGRMHE